MINKAYLNNMPSKNILNDYAPKNLSDDATSDYNDSSLDNMVLNSNLENKNVIK